MCGAREILAREGLLLFRGDILEIEEILVLLEKTLLLEIDEILVDLEGCLIDLVLSCREMRVKYNMQQPLNINGNR